jgi:ATP-binding cassette subfamily B protein
MTPAIHASLWPMARIGDALATLADACGLPEARGEPPGTVPDAIASDRTALEQWLDAAARLRSLEIEPFRPQYGGLEAGLASAGALLLRVPHGNSFAIVAVVGARGQKTRILGPDGMVRRVLIDELADAVRAGFDPRAEARVDALLEASHVAPERRARARIAILGEQLSRRLLDAGFIVTLPPSAPFLAQAREAGLPRQVSGLVVLQLAVQVLSLLAWWLVGKGALDGKLERGWLLAWGLLLATLVPVRLLASWWQGTSAIGFATLLKRRLLFGTLSLEPEETRHQGAGQLLGRVIESEAVESLVTSGAIASALAVVELVLAGVVLGAGAGVASALLLVAWVVVTLFAAWRYWRRLREWAGSRLAMTHDLVERMVGHRTRLAQEPRETWHEAEDDQLAAYAVRSAHLDRLSTWITAVLPRAWLVGGLLMLAPAFIDRARSGTTLAVGVGGVLLAFRALAKLTSGMTSLLGAQVAWAQAGPLFDAGGREEPAGRASLVAASLPADHTGPIVDARDLFFRYDDRGTPILRSVNLRVAARDRLLLQGPSGGGKSTLGAILTGIRAPDSGLLLLTGLDRHTLGPRAWRRRVVAAPQFHENHILTGTFAFNLLMGREWPPRPEDLEQATRVCEELGLGPLLERMPAGLMQMVGETGWQLSHGERSRLFIARALLQRAEMIVLDESFAALDPKTLERALRCVLARAPTLVVIAHP